MLTELTAEQEALMSVVRDEWIALCDNGKHDKVRARTAAEYLYQQAGLKVPPIIVCESPLSAIVALEMVRDSVRASVKASVWASVRASVGDSVRDSVEASVWDSVKASVWEFWWAGCWDYGWCAFYDYLHRIKAIPKHRQFCAYRDTVARSGMWSALAYENVCIVAMMPIQVSRDEQMRLHSEDGYAVEFGDGYGQHYLSGVFFPPDLHKGLVSGAMGVPNVLKIENVEQRMAALKFIGAEKLLQQCDAQLVNKSKRGNKLYHIPDLDGMSVHLVRFICPSTGREYVHFVDYENWVQQAERQADQAVAAMFGWSLEEYDALVWES